MKTMGDFFLGAAASNAATTLLTAFVDSNNKYPAQVKKTLETFLSDVKNIDSSFVGRLQDAISVSGIENPDDLIGVAKLVATTRFKGRWPVTGRDLDVFFEELRREVQDPSYVLPKAVTQSFFDMKKYLVWAGLGVALYFFLKLLMDRSFERKAVSNPKRRSWRDLKKISTPLSGAKKRLAAKNIARLTKKEKRKVHPRSRKQIIRIGLEIARKGRLVPPKHLNPNGELYSKLEPYAYAIGREYLELHDLLEKLKLPVSGAEKARLKEKVREHEKKIKDLEKEFDLVGKK